MAESPSSASLIDFYADAGVEFIGLADARPDDKFGIAALPVDEQRRALMEANILDPRQESLL